MLTHPYSAYADVCRRGHGRALLRELEAAPADARRVLFCAGDSSQCSFFRMYLPALALQRHSPRTYPAVVHWLNAELVAWADIIVIQRMHEPNLVNEVAAARKAGKIVIYDLDDNLHRLDPTNPATPIFDACSYASPKGDVSCYDMAYYFMLMSNVLLFSTENLRQFYTGVTGKRARVIANHFDCAPDYLALRNPAPRQTRIIWAGGTSHVPDLRIVAAPLRRIKQRYGNAVKLIFMGFDGVARQPDGSILDAGARCDVFDAGVAIDQYHAHLAETTPHIGLAPIETSIEFSNYKSPTKWLDYSAVGAATIATDCCVHSPVMVDRANGLLVANDADAWYDAIAALIEQPDLRARLAANARNDLRALDLPHAAAEYDALFDETQRFAPAEHAELIRDLKAAA
jgi:glycosyltransferase involved in cell wall biosynthesis